MKLFRVGCRSKKNNSYIHIYVMTENIEEVPSLMKKSLSGTKHETKSISEINVLADTERKDFDLLIVKREKKKK